MASGSQSNSEPITPTRVWTREEWLAKHREEKDRAFPFIYSGGFNKLGQYLDEQA